MEKTSEFLIYLMACSLQGTKPEEALLANIDMEARFGWRKRILFLQWCAWRWNRPMRSSTPLKPLG